MSTKLSKLLTEILPEMSDIDYTALKATVSESNGEISCSVDETNRLRALLGLRPLKVDSSGGKSKEQESVDNFKRTKEEEER